MIEPALDRREWAGPFDIIGDVHGCWDELQALLARLGYAPGAPVQPPPGRTAVFVGDLVDRGPGVVEVLTLVMAMVAAGTALCVAGNHDDKLRRYLRGHKVRLTHGLLDSVEQLARRAPEFRAQVAEFLERRPSHYVLDAGRLVVAHAGLKADLQGRNDATARRFTLYGDITGETDALGLPVRRNWAAEYQGSALVVYGHTPVARPQWENNTVNIDTGCVFGGRLTALRYPERETVSVPAARVYAAPRRAFLSAD